MSAANRLVVRVLPDVSGLDKAFDYLVPDGLVVTGGLQLGDIVRVDLHGRRVRGWVVELNPPDVTDARLLAIQRWSSRGPDRTLLGLADWASTRWAAGRLRPFLVSASPPRHVVADLPPAADHGNRVDRIDVIRLGPTTDPLPIVVEAIRGRASLVLHPADRATPALARRLSRSGLRVAVWPEQWEQAARGVDVVVGSRQAAWARLPRLEAVVILDEHDEAYQEQRAPTWHARDLLVERARRLGAVATVVSPAPTVTAVQLAQARPAGGLAGERDSWPVIEIVDRSAEEPWKRSLVSTRLIAELRDHRKRIVCVSNTPGRSRRLACRACRSIQRCDRCDAAVGQAEDGHFVCHSCAATRPAVCQDCSSMAMANIRPGVARLREELEAAAGRPVVSVTAETEVLPTADVYVGTEAVLHRVGGVDIVAFLDFDAELLAPRYRAAEQALTLLVRAARLVGPRSRGGRVLVQTHLPDHEVLSAARDTDVGTFTRRQADRRRVLGLPPFGALARVTGAGHADFAGTAAAHDRSIRVTSDEERSLLGAEEWSVLGRALTDAARPSGSRLRIEVDPPR